MPHKNMGRLQNPHLVTRARGREQRETDTQTGSWTETKKVNKDHTLLLCNSDVREPDWSRKKRRKRCAGDEMGCFTAASGKL